MGDYAAKGREYVEKADKKLKGFSLFTWLTSSSAKHEGAVELLERAATQFKLALSWQEAGQVYRRLTELHLALDSRTDSAAAWVAASRAYSHAGDATESAASLRKAIELYTETSKLDIAARHIKALAEETEKAGDKGQASELYNQAAKVFKMENISSEARKCRLKVAFFSAESGDYITAIAIFEDVAAAAADNDLLKFSAKGHLLNAGICHLAGSDQITFQRAMKKYEDIDLHFPDSRKDTLLRDLAGAMEAGDSQKFAESLAEFDSVTRLDVWKTSLLLKVKKRIEEGDADDDLDLS